MLYYDTERERYLRYYHYDDAEERQRLEAEEEAIEAEDIEIQYQQYLFDKAFCEEHGDEALN